MISISQRMIKEVEWNHVYTYAGPTQSFDTYSSTIPHLTVTHIKVKGARKTKIEYRAFGRTTDSPSQAVRWYNDEVKKRRNGGRHEAAGSVEQIRKQRAGGGDGR